MFRFENIEYLYGLLAIPLLVGLYLLYLLWKKRAISKFGDIDVIKNLFSDYSPALNLIKFVNLLLAFAFIILAVANPQVGSKIEKVKRKGVDLIIALDVSNSMLAEDIKPNRLTRAKQAISQLLNRFDDDRIGIIVFAGKAYTQLPITVDYAAAEMFMANVNTDIIPVQGTSIGAAIDLAVESFPKENSKRSRAIIIITDGENHEDDAIASVKEAAKKDIVIHAIGMGSPEGVPIPQKYSGMTMGYKKDNEGNTIMTKLDEAQLRQIAKAGNGVYVRASNTDIGLNAIFDEIGKMQKKEIETKVYSDYEDYFQPLIAIALFFVILEFLLMERKYKWMKNVKLFEVRKIN
ncbi:MAG: VWA domain-containing protein [Bacteroidales bacterium]|nr:VWA domain-containing protein [Bacteroidales bacterium]